MIRLDNVSKTYKNDVVALRDVSVNITKGEFVFLVGASGSGKSTFIKLLIKDEEPDVGDIIVAGKRLRNLRNWRVPSLRRELGCVFQDFRLLESRTVEQNVSFALEVIGAPAGVIGGKVSRVVTQVGLAPTGREFPPGVSGRAPPRVAIPPAVVDRRRLGDRARDRGRPLGDAARRRPHHPDELHERAGGAARRGADRGPAARGGAEPRDGGHQVAVAVDGRRRVVPRLRRAGPAGRCLARSRCR